MQTTDQSHPAAVVDEMLHVAVSLSASSAAKSRMAAAAAAAAAATNTTSMADSGANKQADRLSGTAVA